ncbi:hypothetical protein RRF57_004397 [Xylaria bambusicola]|uniref:Mid2 domain-containing protein n=1 Tax=Xylaria bambusicola TaxID=326684 RepID=A0AAN7Z3T6_9PEZI
MPASEDPRAKFGLTCPVDGQFFICQNSSTKFIGCCKVDPCTSELDGVCPDSELFVASYSAASGMMFLQQDCADPFNGSIWYTCDNARPPFLGCCMNDPCNNGCLDGNLVAATLSNDLKNASQLMLSDTTSTTTDTISSSTSSSTTGTGILPKGTENSSSGSMSSDGARAGMIAGISVAGVVILLLVVAAYLWVKRRERARQKSAYEPGLANGTSENVIPSHGSCQGKYSSPPNLIAWRNL